MGSWVWVSIEVRLRGKSSRAFRRANKSVVVRSFLGNWHYSDVFSTIMDRSDHMTLKIWVMKPQGWDAYVLNSKVQNESGTQNLLLLLLLLTTMLVFPTVVMHPGYLRPVCQHQIQSRCIKRCLVCLLSRIILAKYYFSLVETGI